MTKKSRYSVNKLRDTFDFATVGTQCSQVEYSLSINGIAGSSPTMDEFFSAKIKWLNQAKKFEEELPRELRRNQLASGGLIVNRVPYKKLTTRFIRFYLRQFRHYTGLVEIKHLHVLTLIKMI